MNNEQLWRLRANRIADESDGFAAIFARATGTSARELRSSVAAAQGDLAAVRRKLKEQLDRYASGEMAPAAPGGVTAARFNATTPTIPAPAPVVRSAAEVAREATAARVLRVTR